MSADGIMLLRSLLFMPGDNARAHQKAVGLAADALIFDLEDAVAPADKQAARQCVADSLGEYDYGTRPLFLRINPPHAGTRDEIALLAEYPQLTGVIIAKAETAAVVQQVAGWMDAQGCAPQQRILVNIETPLAVLHAAQIAQAHPRLSAIIAGKNDLTAALHLPDDGDRSGLLYALSQLVLVARAYGLQVFDGVYNRIGDDEGLRRECAEGRRLGFDGKTLIHPAQIAIANQAFSPDAAEIKAAQEIVRRWQQQDKGVTTAGNVMIEELHMRNAQRVLALAKAASTTTCE